MEQPQQENLINEDQPQTPKEVFFKQLSSLFEIIEGLEIPEGEYLKLANLCRDMNIAVNNINDKVSMRVVVQHIANNEFYRENAVERPRSLREKKLTEAEKAVHPAYRLCECGRYVKWWKLLKNDRKTEYNVFIERHLKSLVHIQGVRNSKWARKTEEDNAKSSMINKEVLLDPFCLQHIENQEVSRKGEALEELEANKRGETNNKYVKANINGVIKWYERLIENVKIEDEEDEEDEE